MRETTIYAILARSEHSITRLRTEETGCGKLFNTVKSVLSLVVLTNHGVSAERRSDKVERWGKVTNVSEGEFALRSRLANSLWLTAYTVSLTTSSTVFALQMCSAAPPLLCGICGIGHLLYRSTTIVRVRMVRMSRMSSH